MRTPRAPLSTRELVVRIERAREHAAVDYARAHRALRPDLGACSEPVGGGSVVDTTAFGAPSMSKAFAVALASEERAEPGDEECAEPRAEVGDELAIDARESVARIEAFCAKRNRPARIAVCPFTRLELFAAMGARAFSVDTIDQVLVRDVNPDLGAASPGVDVEEVPKTEEDLAAWGALVRDAMHEGPDARVVEAERERLNDAAFVQTSAMRAFVATLDGRPAGAAGLIVHDGTALLFAMGTLRQHRRRGVQRELVRARLAIARSLGADLAYVLTWPGYASERNLMRLGFRVAYTAFALIAP